MFVVFEHAFESHVSSLVSTALYFNIYSRTHLREGRRNFLLFTICLQPLNFHINTEYEKVNTKTRSNQQRIVYCRCYISLDSRPLSFEKGGLVYTVCACVNCPQDSWGSRYLSKLVSILYIYNDVIAQIIQF